MTETKIAPNHSPEPPAPAAAPSWWERSLTRREANLVGLGAITVGAIGLQGTVTGCCGASEDVSIEDALKIQRTQGWNFGAADKALSFPSSSAVDSAGGESWKTLRTGRALLEVTQPSRETWRAYEGTNLVSSLDQVSLAEQVQPMVTDAMKVAFDKGRSLGSLIAASQDKDKALVIIDLPGPEAVATAAGMAGSVEPVFFFDNWPHPEGVVPSHHTLAALLYYAPELQSGRAQRGSAAGPVALVLDANRLMPYSDAAGLFDNRYLAQLPDEKALGKLGVARVLYVTWGKKQTELDDANTQLVAYKDANIPVQLVSTDAFAKDPQAQPEDKVATSGYYYGGSHHHHTYFYTHYPMFIWLPVHTPRWTPTPTAPPSSVGAAHAYRPKPRATPFSGYKGGLAAGSAKSRPDGFGRVATQKKGSGVSWSKRSSTARPSSGGGYGGGRSSSGRSPGGRSGSWGRSRSGGWGG